MTGKMILGVVMSGTISLFLIGCGDAQMGGSSFETGNTLAGRVVDTNGHAEAGAMIRIRPYWRTGDGSITQEDPSQGVFDLASDSLGRFRVVSVPPGEYRIEIEKCGRGVFVPHSIQPASGINSMGDLGISRLGAISGQVLLPQGCPRAMVQVYGADRTVLTETDGWFFLANIPAGSTRIRAVCVDSARVLGETMANVSPGLTENVGYLLEKSEDPTTWRYGRDIGLNTGSSGVAISEWVMDLPILLRLDSSLFPSEASPNGDDIRVVDKSGKFVPMELSEWDPVLRRARIWIRLDTLFPAAPNRKIRVLWGRTGSVTGSEPHVVWDTARGWSGVWHLSNTRVDSLGRTRTPDATAWRLDGVLTGSNRDQAQSGAVSSHRFDGATDLLRISGTSTEFGTRPFTLEMWVRVASVGASVFNKGIFQRDSGMRQLYLGPKNPTDQVLGWYPTFNVRPDAARSQHSVFSRPLDSTRWTHLTMRMIPSTTNALEVKVDWFVDGIWSDSSTTLCKVSDRPGDSLGVGNVLVGGASPAFHGWMGELRVSGVARSDSWIRLSEAAQTPGNRLVEYLSIP